MKTSPSRKIRPQERRLLWVAFTALALMGGVSWASFLRNRPVDIIIPPPAPLPSPNAYDSYIQASRMLSLPPDAFFYSDRPITQVRPWVKANQCALKTMRAGFPYSCAVPDARSSNPNTQLRRLQLRDLERQIVLESRVRAADGDWNGAMNSRLDGIRLGLDIAHGRYIDRIIGMRIENAMRRDTHLILPHLSASQARAALSRLQKLEARRLTLSANYTEDKWAGLTELEATMHESGWRQFVLHSTETPRTADLASALTVSPRDIARNYIKAMDILIADTKTPYALRRTSIDYGDPYSKMFMPVSEDWRLHDDKNTASNNLFMTALALRMHQAERGALPQKLKDLVPQYLPRIPLDPFGDGQQELRYTRRNDAEYSLYSTGPDGRDDGASPVLSEQGKPSYIIEPDSQGDVVFGINP